MAVKPVKWFDSTMAGAPVLSGTAGSLISVLNACLVDGFNLITLDSLSVSGGVLTGVKAGHGFVVDQVVATAGANEAQLNGEWTVTEVTPTTFKASASIANVTGTGTISAKAAPLGWLKPYVGTNKAAYKSASPESTGMLLRVDDTLAQYAVVSGYESMSDVESGTGIFPTLLQASSRLGWGKSSTSNTTARPWSLFGDDRLMYFLRSPSSANSSAQLHMFGDLVSDRVAGDPYCCFISGYNNPPSSTTNIPCGVATVDGYSSTDVIYAARPYTQLGGAAQCGTYSLRISGSSLSGGSLNNKQMSPLNNKVQVSPVLMVEVSTGAIRASNVAGLYHSISYLPLSHLERTLNVTGISGRKLIACATGSSGSEGRVFLDITGPWR